MKDLASLVKDLEVAPIVPAKQFKAIDLSHSSPLMETLDLNQRDTVEAWFAEHCSAELALHGGYMEKRNWYGRNSNFVSGETTRNMHLGEDLWMPAKTPVFAPLPGKVHSKANNKAVGDYGFTIILQHEVQDSVFFTLYGHLGKAGFDALHPGDSIATGQQIGVLGAWEENGGWPPHVHFQVMWDMEGKAGDYPGVCFEAEQAEYAQRCPNPKYLVAGLIG